MPRADSSTTRVAASVRVGAGRRTRARAAEAELHLAGTGSFAAEVAEWAQDAGWNVTRLIELLDASRVGLVAGECEVAAPESPRSASVRAAIALGGARRAHWSRLEPLGWRGATIVHPAAHVSRSAQLAEGCIIGPGATIGAQTTVGEHTLISRGTLIGHHVEVGSFASLLPGVNVGGGAVLGDDVIVGMGAVILNGVRVDARATVAAGALVLSDVREGSRVQGLPAREYPG
ncbi:MAG: hypothetical protein E6G34_05445 [Actinobacteria bacterium]|nr:MAG: hypothetical protein E6G34_05445 [Actinomycetota bacterium]